MPSLVEQHHEAIYPPEELAARNHATVALLVSVDAEGHVTSVDVAQSGGKAFDAASIAAMRLWTFRPATRDGRLSPSIGTVDLNARSVLHRPSRDLGCRGFVCP